MRCQTPQVEIMKSTQACHIFVIFVLAGLIALIPALSFAQEAPSVRTNKGVVAADHPLASEVGASVLAAGGNAADAGVATLLTLGLVNPFASGLGGGGFCLHRSAESGEVDVLDFRERAPGNSTRDMYIRDGKADIGLMMRGGLAVGVPGEAAGLWALHQKYGSRPWRTLVDRAAVLARDGFPAGELLPKRLARAEKTLLEPEHKAHASIYRRKNRWVQSGETVKNPGLAKLLEKLRDEGPRAYYEGPVASAIVEAVRDAGGILTEDDLRNYKVTWREPIRGEYRSDYEVYSMPPPSSGGVAIITALNVLNGIDLKTLGWTPAGIHMISETLKHVFADRARWLGDADFVAVPVEKLTSIEYALQLRGRILPWTVRDLEDYGTASQVPDDDGTSHVSIVDRRGNMLACTSTINTTFGSKVFVEKYGMVLNNEMGDFTAQPGVPNNYGLMGTEQNAVEPGKRPLSSMSPTLILKNGKPFLAAGASGGPTIITGTLLSILRVIDYGQTPAEAVAADRFHHQWLPEKLFIEGARDWMVQDLRERGHEVVVRNMFNSVQMVVVVGDDLVGVSDPRKHGAPAAPKK